MSKNAKMQIDALQTARGLEVGLQHAVDCSNRGGLEGLYQTLTKLNIKLLYTARKAKQGFCINIFVFVYFKRLWHLLEPS